MSNHDLCAECDRHVEYGHDCPESRCAAEYYSVMFAIKNDGAKAKRKADKKAAKA